MEANREEKNNELIKLWKESLILDEYRDIYKKMTDDQKKIVLFALKWKPINN